MDSIGNIYGTVFPHFVSVAGPYNVGHTVVPMDNAVSFAPPTVRRVPGGTNSNAPAYKVIPERFNFMGTNQPK